MKSGGRPGNETKFGVGLGTRQNLGVGLGTR